MKLALPFRLWPRTMAGQLILLLLALIIAQGVAFSIFASEHRAAVLALRQGQAAERTAAMLRIIDALPAQGHEDVLRAASSRGLLFWTSEASVVDPREDAETDGFFANRLRDHLGSPERAVRIGYSKHKPDVPWAKRHRRHWDEDDDDFDDDDHDRGEEDDDDHWEHRRGSGPALWRHGPVNFVISAKTTAGWLNVRVGVPPRAERWAVPSLVAMAFMAGAILIISIVMVRRITRPMARLAGAAEAMGRGAFVGAGSTGLEPEGPAEVRQAIEAFLAMQERIDRFVKDRTTMLAAISHDLRTPLTALRLRAEFVEDEENRDKMTAAIDELIGMTEAALRFAKDEAADERAVRLNLADVLNELVQEQQALGAEVSFTSSDAVWLDVKPVSLKRALRNVIGNAVRYGSRADITLAMGTDGFADVTVEDDGPGIPEDDMARVFEPFVRLEGSRSAETGGIGLGLAVARTAMQAHGGDIQLANRAEGGLCVTVRLPLPPEH